MWGWEPATTTVHEYDDAGRLIRSVATPEPEWDAQSYGLMAALQEYEDGLCPKHGGPISECTDPLADPSNPASTHRYEANMVGRCFVADAMARTEESMHENKITRPASIIVGVERVARLPRNR